MNSVIKKESVEDAEDLSSFSVFEHETISSDESHDFEFVDVSEISELCLKVKVEPELSQSDKPETRIALENHGQKIKQESRHCTKGINDEICEGELVNVDECSASLTCNICEKQFQSEAELTVHSQIHVHSEIKPLLAIVPDESEKESSFAEKVDTADPSSFHHSGKKLPFICGECGKAFPFKSILNRHMTGHTGQRPFTCKECGKSYALKGYLTKHSKIHTGKFNCKECGKSFADKDYLAVHMKIHRGEKSFLCSICGKSFASRGSLIRHTRIHTGEKRFACEECGKLYNQNSQLTEHMATHTEEKPVTCKECGKSFTRDGSLAVHMRQHTGEKPFVCNECGKSFAQKTSLVKHTRVHTGEKPFLCKECGKSFSQGGTLARHLMVVHAKQSNSFVR